MKTLNILSVSIFSPGQIAAIVIVAVLLALLIAANIVLAYLFHRRGERKLYDMQLQKRREMLLEKLGRMKDGSYEFASEEEVKEEPEDEVEEIAVLADDGDAIEEEVEESGRIIRYNRSFTARITQSDGDLKARYSELKNYILSYSGVREHLSWKHETYRVGRKNVCSFMVRGKTLCLCMAIEPKLFEGTKYKVDDLSERSKHAKFPCMYRLTSDRKVGYAKELIDLTMERVDVKKAHEYKVSDYTLPYKSTEVLVKNRLIKVIGEVQPDFTAEDAAAAKKGISYNRSFTARIIQSNDALKAAYSEIKNYLLSYNGIVARSSWKREAYCYEKTCVASVMVRGKTLCLCLATDPARFKKTKYKVEDLSLRSKKNKTPCMYRVNGSRKMEYAKQLIDFVFAEFKIAKADTHETVNYAVPYTSTENLIRKNMIRVTKRAPFKYSPNAEDSAAEEPVRSEAAATAEQAV